jgi:hypothetical protein
MKTLGIIVIAAVVVLVMTACDDLLGESFDPPDGVVATMLSNRTIHVTWNRVSGAKRYTIAYRTNLDSADTRRDAGSSSITTFTHDYYYRVTTDATTLYYYVKAHNRDNTWEEGYKATGYSSPVSVDIR